MVFRRLDGAKEFTDLSVVFVGVTQLINMSCMVLLHISRALNVFCLTPINKLPLHVNTPSLCTKSHQCIGHALRSTIRKRFMLRLSGLICVAEYRGSEVKRHRDGDAGRNVFCRDVA